MVNLEIGIVKLKSRNEAVRAPTSGSTPYRVLRTDSIYIQQGESHVEIMSKNEKESMYPILFSHVLSICELSCIQKPILLIQSALHDWPADLLSKVAENEVDTAPSLSHIELKIDLNNGSTQRLQSGNLESNSLNLDGVSYGKKSGNFSRKIATSDYGGGIYNVCNM